MYERILVPIDGSATARCGLDEAIALAARLGATLQLLHVVDARLLVADVAAFAPSVSLLDDARAAGEKLLAEAVAHARGRGVQADSTLQCDPGLRVCDLILAAARGPGVGLIVMGTHGRRGLRRLALGSDAELVLRESPVPVLLVRAQDGEAPA